MRVFRALLIVGLIPCAVCAAGLRAADVYRVPAGVRDGLRIWIVDGNAIRRDVYPDFISGGNGERNPFIPPREIWIDHAMGVEEFQYTLEHEILERSLMARRAMSYANAHDSALALESTLRTADANAANAHEWVLHRVSPTDCDNVKQIPSLPDSIELHGIYRVDLGARADLRVWIVDGATIRREIYPDFGFSGNDRVYRFVPPGEIWIDNALGAEELEAAIVTEVEIRTRMAAGDDYDVAYERAVKKASRVRKGWRQSVLAHPALKIGKILERDIGTGSERRTEGR